MSDKYEKRLGKGIDINQPDTVDDESLPSDEDDDSVAAIEEALDEIRAGVPGIPFDQFEREFRQRHGLS